MVSEDNYYYITNNEKNEVLTIGEYYHQGNKVLVTKKDTKTYGDEVQFNFRKNKNGSYSIRHKKSGEYLRPENAIISGSKTSYYIKTIPEIKPYNHPVSPGFEWKIEEENGTVFISESRGYISLYKGQSGGPIVVSKGYNKGDANSKNNFKYKIGVIKGGDKPPTGKPGPSGGELNLEEKPFIVETDKMTFYTNDNNYVRLFGTITEANTCWKENCTFKFVKTDREGEYLLVHVKSGKHAVLTYIEKMTHALKNTGMPLEIPKLDITFTLSDSIPKMNPELTTVVDRDNDPGYGYGQSVVTYYFYKFRVTKSTTSGLYDLGVWYKNKEYKLIGTDASTEGQVKEMDPIVLQDYTYHDFLFPNVRKSRFTINFLENKTENFGMISKKISYTNIILIVIILVLLALFLINRFNSF